MATVQDINLSEFDHNVKTAVTCLCGTRGIAILYGCIINKSTWAITSDAA